MGKLRIWHEKGCPWVYEMGECTCPQDLTSQSIAVDLDTEGNMATSTMSTGALVLQLPGELLGPGSEYEERRIALRKEWEPIVEAAKKVKVLDGQSCEEAVNLGRLLQASGKEVETFYKPIKTQIDSLKKPVLAAENADNAVIDAEKKQLGEQITKYNAEQRRIREEQERVAREAAEKQAREDALNRAIELEEQGQLEQSKAILEETVHAPAIVIQQTAPPRAAGQVGKFTYSMEVLDERKLLEAVLKDRTLLPAITINAGWLNRKAGLDKEGFSVPGCKLVKKETTHFRA